MAMLVKEMAPLCALYDVDFRNVLEEHELVAGEKMNGKVDLVLADHPYNVRRDREERNADHYVSALEDIKDMASVLEEVMKPEGHGDWFCSVLQFAIWYRALSAKKTEEQVHSEKEGKESESGSAETTKWRCSRYSR